MSFGSDRLRKVALLVTSLDREAADELLDQLGPDEAQEIRNAVLGLSEVDPREQTAVIRDFLQVESPGAGRQASRYALSASSEAVGIPCNDRPMHKTDARHRVLSDDDDKLIQPLERASERLIAECLSDEMPQAIAVALAQLPTHRASDVVAHLPDALQAEVLERMVELDPASSLDAPEIREEFHQWLNQQIERCMHRAELAARLAAILDATHSGTRLRILDNISSNDASLAKELQHQLAALSETASLADTSCP